MARVKFTAATIESIRPASKRVDYFDATLGGFGLRVTPTGAKTWFYWYRLPTGKARRWTIEPSFRDTKDLRFGMGMAEIRIADPERRDRLLLISAFAMALLTMLGAAGESLGMDRLLKSNTSKTRTHSLFRQGCMLYELIPNMPEHRLGPLMRRFAEILLSSGLFGGFLSAAE